MSMFTGIVQAVSPVTLVTVADGVRRVRIRKPARWKLVRGQSIAVDGICSTVVTHASSFFDVEYMPETLRKTTASLFVKGVRVNLERSLRFGDSVDGHLMQGHVDGRVRVVATIDTGHSRTIVLALPKGTATRVALHGSVAINGVSLTAIRVRGNTCAIALIPFTLSHTNLGNLSVGDFVNIELDRTSILARKAARARVRQHESKRVRKKTRRA